MSFQLLIGINYLYLETLLSKYSVIDCKIIHAKNGQEALDFCELNTIDLVLMDIKMPVLNGY